MIKAFEVKRSLQSLKKLQQSPKSHLHQPRGQMVDLKVDQNL